MKSKDYKIIIIITLVLITTFDFALRSYVEVQKLVSNPDSKFNFWNIVPYAKGKKSSMKLEPYLVFQGKRDDANNPSDKTRSRKRFYEPKNENNNSSKILFLGGSVVENMSINLDRLENALSNIGYKYQFINGGWSAYNITQEFILLSQIIHTIRPQYVVLFDGFNDIWLSIYDRYPIGYPQHFKKIEMINQYVDSPYASLINDIADRIFFVRIMKYKLAKSNSEATFNNEETNNLISKYYNQYVKNIAALCSYNNVELIVIHQPSLFTKKELSFEEMEWTKSHKFEWTFKSSYLEAWSIMKDETKTLSSELGFDYYDWSTLFDEASETIFYDMVHFQKKDHYRSYMADNILIDSLKSLIIENYSNLSSLDK